MTSFDKVAIPQLRNHNLKIWSTFFSLTLRYEKNQVQLLTIYMAYKLKNGHFFGKKRSILIFYTPHSPQCSGMRTILPFFFLTFAFFMLNHDILKHCTSYKCMNKGDFISLSEK